MFLLKEITIIAVVQACIGYASFDFSAMDSVHDEMMKFYGGTERTVNVLKAKLVDPPSFPPPTRPPSKKSPGSDSVRKKGGLVTSVSVDLSAASSGGGSRGSSGSTVTPFLRPHLSLRLKPKRPKAKTKKPKAKLIYIQQTKTYKRRRTPSNKFLEALNAIERGVAEAKATQNLKKNKRNIQQQTASAKNVLKLAVQNRMFQYARNKLGHTLYHIQHSRSKRPKRSTQNDTSTFMSDLRVKMGSEKFDEFMAVMGDVTLMFAIDTTGSMADEIETAKKIAVDVINYPRRNPVSYILSPFSDPKTGPVTYRNSSAGALFVNEISKLNAAGGGDCPELTMTGTLNALYEGPDWGSPLYVFTDASAKDDSKANIQEVKQMAELQGNTINFFTTGSHCSKPKYAAFQEIADATSGQVLPLSNSQELQQLTGFTGSVLGGSNVVSLGSNANSSLRKRRSLKVGHGAARRSRLSTRRKIAHIFGKRRRKNRKLVAPQHDYRYKIAVDDSMEKMSVCITTTRINQGSTITLANPGGVKITSGKNSMSRITVYEITKPRVGTWTLTIPSGCGTHNHYVKSTSDTNIDIEHYFIQQLPGPISDVPISQPLIGRPTKLIVTIAGYHKVQKDTVALELIKKYGEHIRYVTLTPDKRGMRYIATLTPPSRPFKLKINGTTKAGNSFERISRSVIEPKHVMLRVLHSNKDFTLQRGQKTSVTFHIFNSNAGEKMRVSVKDRLGYAVPLTRSTRMVRKGRWAFFRVVFNVPVNAKIGASDTAIVSLSYNGGVGLVTTAVQLLVVS